MASRKHFHDFAVGLAHRFISRNNDIGGYWGVGVLAKDLHASGRDQQEFNLLEAPQPWVADSHRWLLHRLEVTHTPSDWLNAATLWVTYTPVERRGFGDEWYTHRLRASRAQIYRAVALVVLIDDNGHRREARAGVWCWDHDPECELRNPGALGR